MLTPIDEFEQYKDATKESIKGLFPIEGRKNVLELKNIKINDNLQMDDYEKQKQMKMAGRSYTIPVSGTLVLKDKKTGKKLDEKSVKFADLPKLTDRGSYIVGGNEYSTPYQLLRRSGVFVRKTDANDIEAEFNLEKGRRATKLFLNPKTGVFTMKIKTSNPRLYPIMSALGMSDEALKKAWGEDIFEKNKKLTGKRKEAEVMKAYSAVWGKEAEDYEAAVEGIKEWFESTALDPETVEMSIGKPYSKLSTDLLLDVSKKSIRVNRKEEPPDERDALYYKKIRGADDYIRDRITKNAVQIKSKYKNKLDLRNTVEEIHNKGFVNDKIKTFFTSTSNSQVSDQTNPVTLISNQNEITIMGMGGIEEENKLSLSMQAVHPSHFNFIDPIHTPESAKSGAIMHTAIAAGRDGNTMVSTVWDVKKKKAVRINPKKFNESIVSFPGEYSKDFKPLKKKVKAFIKGNRIERVKPSEVDYVMYSPTMAFDVTTNMVPFLNSDMGFRAQMASKQMGQALSLKHREQPLVQPEFIDSTFDKVLGDASAIKATVAGKVTSIRDGRITIADKSGKKHGINYYRNFPLNTKSAYLDTEIKVKPGDTVKKGQVLGDINFTKDGTLALGTNMNVAYMPYRGYNFEDGVVVSEQGANRLTSQHMYKVKAERANDTVFNLKKFKAYFPSVITAEMSAKLDDEGVIKKGSKLNPGDVIIASARITEMTPEQRTLKKIARWFEPYVNTSETWDNDHVGEVVDVVKSGKSIKVLIRSDEPARIGDKVAGRHGNKGVITKIIPDAETPTLPNGDKIDVIFDPHALISRLNPSQVLEVSAAKVAEKTGVPFVAKNFFEESNSKAVKSAMAKAGVKDRIKIHDPVDNKTKNVLAGKQYILKLDHQAASKIQARSKGKYDINMMPVRGGGEGKRVGAMEFYSLLSHGSRDVLKEFATYKTDKNDELWRKIETGQPIPPPKVTFATDKFFNMMRAAGINVEKKGNKIALLPLLDKDIKQMSNGEIKDFKILNAKRLEPADSGLFDPKVTGGMLGEKWGHVKLKEPIPNPAMEDAVRSITGLTKNEFNSIVGGKKWVTNEGEIIGTETSSAATGGKAIKRLLSKVDMNKVLKESEEKAKTAKNAELNKLNKKIRVLKNLKNLGMKPSDYMINNVPVLPPVFRPTYPLPDGSVGASDLNYLYIDLMSVNRQLGIKDLPDKEKTELRKDLYNSAKAIWGLGDPISTRDQERKGIIEQIKGNRNKEGYFQSRLVSKTEDLSARAAIGVEPGLHPDEAGIPEDMAWKVYEPFLVKNLVTRGFSPLDAKKNVKERTPAATDALNLEIKQRPVFLNRAPSLHKFSFLSFKPKLVKGDSILIHPLVTTGFNADFDGDQMNLHVPLTSKAVEESFNMFPSKHIFKPTTNTPIMKPAESALLGLYNMTRDGRNLGKTYRTFAEANADYKAGKIKINDLVTIAGKKKTSVGKYLVMALFPESIRDYRAVMTKKVAQDFIAKTKSSSPKGFSDMLDKLNRLGNEHSYSEGLSYSLKEIMAKPPGAADIIKKADSVVDGLSDEKRIDFLGKVQSQMNSLTKTGLKNNLLADMATSGSKGKIGHVSQIVNGPIMMADEKGKPLPYLIGSSYSDGLSLPDYLSTTFGVRKSIIDKVKEVRDPSYFGKLMINASIDKVISEDDCGTRKGVEMSTDNSEILGRFLAKSVPGYAKRNELITPTVQVKLKKSGKKKVLVRSTLKCEADNAFCSKCYGSDENWQPVKVGDNIGVKVAQAISEPATQMTLGATHSGGAAGSAISAYDRTSQIFNSPTKIPFQAVLSEKEGKIDSIEDNPAGGKNIFVSGEKYWASVDVDPIVKKGDAVEKGERLTSGNINQNDLLRLKGIEDVREYMTDEAKKVYDETGAKIHRKLFETAVRGVTNITRVNDPGDNNGFSSGDWAPLNSVDKINSAMKPFTMPTKRAGGRKLANDVETFKSGDRVTSDVISSLSKKGIDEIKVKPNKIKHTPTLRNLENQRLSTYDWLSRLNTSRLMDTITSGAQEGWVTDVHGYNPIPAYVFGQEFGKGMDGRY